ncbi:hypothetical protein OG963_02265 [Streptomyces sp. NBC_01707]|jgi:hypothetical protein|uniref:hypothetical protein n=1 Tax=unclassified Streptomyces TaxID=2593676 RepID=UPI0004C7B639|nr:MULTISPECIES: hypothetical protein [unclassified Streptomyces]MDX3771071.1 hypothetical protein [Streptomyces sp. AK08-01B]MDX3821222.1 hypothetical protein [Streptomyces sp. AK08-01A]WSQ24672.1 hypothetical protein OG763_01735 [Streptomyces sp. NBC_01230]SCY22226.1 hypothetical protein SAMN02745898_1011279 [Streptomyces sp. 136MFCol5.1]
MTRIRRAPWWIYVVAIGGLNIVRQVLFPPAQVGTAVTVGLFFAVLAIGFAVVTVLHAFIAPRVRE